MNFSDLERAIELRQQCAQAAITASADTKKRGRDEEAIYHQIQAESSFLLLNHTRTSSEHVNHRTGRWSNEEVAFVDDLVLAFDLGTLPLPHGIKLNEFLGDMLLCKSSRLTKKMKNAKLSTRSYTLGLLDSRNSQLCTTFASLQDQFLHSVASEPMQLELRFNMVKLWRTHFSNLCLQVGYESLDARLWLSSLEEMEARAADAEDYVRKARRRRMGLALRNDVGSTASSGVFIAGRPANETTPAEVSSNANIVPHHPPKNVSTVTDSTTPTFHAEVSDSSEQPDQDDMDMLADVFGTSIRPRSDSMDFSIGDDFDDYFHDQLAPQSNDAMEPLGDCGPFLDYVIQYMEKELSPFDHVDVWAPSYVNHKGIGVSQEGDSLRLYHAGHATRSDINSTLAFQLNEYGVYSTNFSFAPGVGLPGRVYNLGQASWENQVSEADPVYFERAGGAKIYGVKTALGIPLECATIGRMILGMYSSNDIKADPCLIERYAADIAKWTPKPKWKLVIDLGSGSSAVKASEDTSQTIARVTASVHFPPSVPQVLSERSMMNPLLSPASLGRNVTVNPSWRTVNSTPPIVPQPCPSTMSWQLLTSSPQNMISEDEEQCVATLLGQHIPMSSSISHGHGDESSLLPHFMSLRLLLLRSVDRRSTEEQDLLNILLRSFRCYSKDNHRSGAELAFLLAKDWMFLASSLTPITASPNPVMGTQTRLEQHSCHIFAAPNLSTHSRTGAPLQPHAPSTFGSLVSLGSLQSIDAIASLQHHAHSRHPQQGERRVSEDIFHANIVEES